jgi:hypothetical protein
MFQEFQSSVGVLWCSLAHESVMWPIHGHYECRSCGRRYDAFAAVPAAGRTSSSPLPVAAHSVHHA